MARDVPRTIERRDKRSGTPRWEHFPHGADIGVRGIAPTKHEAFEQSALAMIGVVTDPATVEGQQVVNVTCTAPDDELLLVDWLNALVLEMAVRHLLFGRFEVEIEDHGLSARAWGEAVNPARHRPAVEVKGATYTALHVAFENGEWVAQTVVDV